MKKSLLLPHGFQKIGWAILIPVVLYHIVVVLILDRDNEEVGKAIFNLLNLPVHLSSDGDNTLLWNNAEQWLNNICIFGVVLGGLFIGCSREKIEDELTERLRHNSLLIALWVNYGILLGASLLVYNLNFINVMVYNMFTMLLIFVAVFRWKLWRLRKEVQDEE